MRGSSKPLDILTNSLVKPFITLTSPTSFLV
jgi:hypothetical protein